MPDESLGFLTIEVYADADEVERLFSDPKESADTISSPIPGRIKKSEARGPGISPFAAAALVHHWIERDGEAAALGKDLDERIGPADFGRIGRAVYALVAVVQHLDRKSVV